MSLLTDLQIGHAAYADQTGVTVLLPRVPARAAVWMCGSAPATREIELLAPEATIETIDALLFTGGSAWGLQTAQGVMQWLRDHNRGLKTFGGSVPIVPAAAIYDLFQSKGVIPDAALAYQACDAAIHATETDYYQTGRVGAGTGATVGKFKLEVGHTPGGWGITTMPLTEHVFITVGVVVNAYGNVIDTQGQVFAGCKDSSASDYFRQNPLLTNFIEKTSNTTLAFVATNAYFDKSSLKRIAKMASAGLARAIDPVFTSLDGDMVFALSLGEKTAHEILIGTLAAEALTSAIRQAVCPV